MTPKPSPALLAAALSTLLAAALPGRAAGADAPPVPVLGDLAAAMQSAPRATIYVARRILTMDPRRSVGEAVAVVGDRVLAVGTLEDLKPAAGETPFTVDETFKDKILVPGFVDRGLHPLLAALTLTAEVISVEDWSLPDGLRPAARDRQTWLARLGEAEAKMADPKSLLLVWGWHPAVHGELIRDDLDAVDKTRPILVWQHSGFAMVLNGAALERYGVSADFLARQGPAARAASDLAAGRFDGPGTMALLPLIGPAIATPERLRKGLALVEGYVHAAGVTAVAAPVRPLALLAEPGGTPDEDTRLYRTWLIPDGRELAERWGDDPERLQAEMDRLAALGGGSTRVLPRAVGLSADGGLLDNGFRAEATGGPATGGWAMDPARFERAFGAFWDAGCQIQVQAQGDQALELLLDSLERSMIRRPRFDHRTVAVGFGLASEGQIRRLARLGGVVAANPYLAGLAADLAGLGAVALGTNGAGSSGGAPGAGSGAAPGPVTGPVGSPADRLMPLAAAKRAGLPVALQSDLPLAPAEPLRLMRAAVLRLALSGRPTAADQRLAAEDALAAVTVNAAYSLRLEDRIGSIEPGKLANFTVLESDPLSVPPEQIDTVGVWGTVLEGRVQPVERPSLPARTAARPPVPGSRGTVAAVP